MRDAVIANRAIEHDLQYKLKALDKMKLLAGMQHDQERTMFLNGMSSSSEALNEFGTTPPARSRLTRQISRSLEEVNRVKGRTTKLIRASLSHH